MAAVTVLLLCVMALAPTGVSGYAFGAPSSSCSSLSVGHGRRRDSLPYRLRVGSSTYGDSTPVTVAVEGGQYEGLMMQAQVAGSPVGRFLPTANMRQLRCVQADDTMTHKNTNKKDHSTVFTWVPPGANVGPVQFVATVAENFSTWKGSVKSQVVNYVAVPSVAPPGTGTGDSTTTQATSGAVGVETTRAAGNTAPPVPDNGMPDDSNSKEDSESDESESDESESEDSDSESDSRSGNEESTEVSTEEVQDMDEESEMVEDMPEEDTHDTDNEAEATEVPVNSPLTGSPEVDTAQDNAPVEPLISSMNDEPRAVEGVGAPPGDALQTSEVMADDRQALEAALQTSEVMADDRQALEAVFNGADPKADKTLVTVFIVVGAVIAAVTL